MTAKTLKNPALREKFHVGDIVRLPRQPELMVPSHLQPPARPEHIVMEVGDRMIQHGKNRLCRFSIVLGDGTSSSFKGAVLWEEWMLEKIEILSKAGADKVLDCALFEDETSLPPHQ